MAARVQYPEFPAGLYVRIRPDFPRRDRAGKDGMVHKDLDQSVILSFGHDRFTRYQGLPPTLPEKWSKRDTQLDSLGYA